MQVLLSLLYKAAEFGAQRFVKMLLNSPFGKSIFHEYKNSALLPEVVARNHGHEHTALYLEGITNRLVFYTSDPLHKNAASNRYLNTVSLSVFYLFPGKFFLRTP